MNWVRIVSSAFVAGPIVLAAAIDFMPAAGHALTQPAGLLQIGPSNADGNEQNHSAILTTTITNQSDLPDRLINVACPGTGTAGLVNGHLKPLTPGSDVQRNGLDIPGSLDGRAAPVVAQFNLSNATQPMTPATLIPCALYFQRAGQRIVVFSLGVHEQATSEP